MITRLLKYGLVGASGVIVNLVVLTIADRLLPHFPTISYLFAVEASIISNYLLNARFTFRQSFSWKGLGQYDLVSAAGAIIQTGIYRYLLTWHWSHILADLVAIPFGTGFGFLFSSIWVFKKREVVYEPDPQRPAVDPHAQGTDGHR